MMLLTILSLSTSTLIGVLSYFVFQQYNRVKKRDALRSRIQTYKPLKPSTSSSFSYDPLDHSLYWYPIAFSHELPLGSSRPFGFYLLNEPLCLYRTKDGEVVCVLDLCPHRSARLSLGLMTKEGNLECIYHGWQFGSNGQCVRIPSVSKTSNTASLICARTVPVHEQYGFIWIWPGKRELADSALIPHALFADVQNADGKFLLSPENTASLDIPYELMVDNLLDYAHVDFTHDGTIGKRSQASCIRSERITPSPFLSTNSEAASFRLQKYEQTPPTNRFSHIHFIPPCFARLEHHGPKPENIFVQLFFILPTAEKKMRLLLQFYRNFACYKWIEYFPGFDYLIEKFNKIIIDQDVLLLDGINRNIDEMGAKALNKIVSADAPIRAFRRYQSRALAKYGTIYVKSAWTPTTKPVDDGVQEIDIEDLAK